jgi:hypothetical protein
LRYALLGFLVLFIIILLISKNYGIWTRPIEFVPKKMSAEKSKAKMESPLATLIQKELPANDSHIFISQKNIFSPDRKDFPVLEGKKPVVRPQVILYGVTVAGDYQSACIGNSGSPLKKGEREAMTIKIGDRIGEYKLVKILPDRIALEAMEETFEVLLYDPSKPKKRIYAKTEVKSAAITSTLSASPSSSTTSPASLQTTPSQETLKSAESVTGRMARTQAPKPAPPAPSPSPRSGRAPAGPVYPPSPSASVGPPGASTGRQNP